MTSRSKELRFEKRDAVLDPGEEMEEAAGEWLAFWFDKKLVEVMIGEVLADSDDESEKAASLSVFKRQSVEVDGFVGCGGGDVEKIGGGILRK